MADSQLHNWFAARCDLIVLWCGAHQVWVHVEIPQRSWERAVSRHFHPARELGRNSYTQANYSEVLGACYISSGDSRGADLAVQQVHGLRQHLWSVRSLSNPEEFQGVFVCGQVGRKPSKLT